MRTKIKRGVAAGGMISFFLLLALYAFYQTRGLGGGVRFDELSIENLSLTHSPLLEVNGQVRYANSLKINGLSIPLGRDGSFKESLLLGDGYNILTFAALNKF